MRQLQGSSHAHFPPYTGFNNTEYRLRVAVNRGGHHTEFGEKQVKAALNYARVIFSKTNLYQLG